MTSSLFISYSHLDEAWMSLVRKHLDGMLHEQCTVWTDSEIPPGSTWERHLLAQMHHSAAALVLVSPDYLVSPWCRRELKSLFEMRQRGTLAAVYWILLRPCGWKRTELQQLQAVQSPATQALLDLPEGPERELALLSCCDRIVGDMLRQMADGDPTVATVRELLAKSDRGTSITVHSPLGKSENGKQGDFALICVGNRDNGEKVVIKVLVNTPLHRLRELFMKVSLARAQISDPSAIPVGEGDVFSVGKGVDERVVILSELARGRPLAEVMKGDAKLPISRRRLNIDSVGQVLRRLAEALKALHALDPIVSEDGLDIYVHVMGPLTLSNIFYDTLTGRPQIAFLGVTNFLWYFFDPVTFRRMVTPEGEIHELPQPFHESGSTGQKLESKALKDYANRLQKADLYFLGVLAMELLKGGPLYDSEVDLRDSSPRKLLELLNEPPDWAWRHEQLLGIVKSLLRADEKKVKPFDDMEQLLVQLRGLEESSRALAKYSFNKHLTVANDEKGWKDFSSGFYQNFFAKRPAQRAVFAKAAKAPPENVESFMPGDAHHDKLRDGLKAVLNFRPGGQPSAIDSYAAYHRERKFILDSDALCDFRDSFLAALRDRLKDTTKGGADRRSDDDIKEIEDAWKMLFAPVIAEMSPDAAPPQPAA